MPEIASNPLIIVDIMRDEQCSKIKIDSGQAECSNAISWLQISKKPKDRGLIRNEASLHVFLPDNTQIHAFFTPVAIDNTIGIVYSCY